MSQGVIAVPLWIPQLGYSGGLVILLIAFVDELIHVLRGYPPRYEKPKPKTRRGSRRARDPERGLTWSFSPHRAILFGFLIVAARVAASGSAIALMATGWAGMQFAGGGIPAGRVLATTVWGNSASWSLAALPLFIWMGEILFRTRLSEEMFRGFAPWLNWLPGRLMHVNVLACGVFGSVSGSSAATCATVAKIALPELKKRGYDEKLSARLARRCGHARHPHPAVDHDGGLRGAGQCLDHPGFPRGLPAGPAGDGAVLRLHRALVARSIRQRTPPADPPMPFREKLRESLNLIPVLLLIVFVFLSLLMGWATATECAAWGVLGSLAIAWWQGSLTLAVVLGRA